MLASVAVFKTRSFRADNCEAHLLHVISSAFNISCLYSFAEIVYRSDTNDISRRTAVITDVYFSDYGRFKAIPEREVVGEDSCLAIA